MWQPSLPVTHGDIAHRSPLMIALWSSCFAPCDLCTTRAHTKTKGTSRQMRYRLFANARSIAWIITALHIICILHIALVSVFEVEITDDWWMWPSQGLQNDGISSNSLTSQFAYHDLCSRRRQPGLCHLKSSHYRQKVPLSTPTSKYLIWYNLHLPPQPFNCLHQLRRGVSPLMLAATVFPCLWTFAAAERMQATSFALISAVPVIIIAKKPQQLNSVPICWRNWDKVYFRGNRG